MAKFSGVPQKRNILSFFGRVPASSPPESQMQAAKKVKPVLPSTNTPRGLSPLSVDYRPPIIKTQLSNASFLSVEGSASSTIDHKAVADEQIEGSHVHHSDVGTKQSEVPVVEPEDDEDKELLSADSSGSFRTIQPFAQPPEDTYVCPFKKNGDCRRSETFKDYKALANHCYNKHRGQILTPFDQDPLEDGTQKVPCSRSCGALFASYDSAIVHARKNCTLPSSTHWPRDCPWPDCATVSIANSRGYATHAGTHKMDPRGIYQCSKCEEYWYDLYLLSSHETRCENRTPRFDGVLQVKLDHSAADIPSMVIVARASSHAPKAWFCAREFLHEGIEVFANNRLEELKGDMDFDGSASFVALYDVHTRLVPTDAHTEAHTTTDPSQKSFFSRAHKFTNAVDTALAAMARLDPAQPRYLVSIGLDGFVCHAPLILPWLKRSPAFTLVIRETELVYGMKEEFFYQAPTGIYYGLFDSRKIQTSLETGVSTDIATANLLDAWLKCQNWKADAPSNNGRTIGRNGDHNIVLKKSKRGPQRGSKAKT